MKLWIHGPEVLVQFDWVSWTRGGYRLIGKWCVGLERRSFRLNAYVPVVYPRLWRERGSQPLAPALEIDRQALAERRERVT